MFKLQAVSDQILYHTDGQLTRARSKWLPMDDFQAAKLTRRAEVDFVRGTATEPSSAAAPGPLTLPNDRSQYNRTRRRPEPRTHLAQRGSHGDALKELLPQPRSVLRGRNKQ